MRPDAIQALNRLCVDPETRDIRFAVSRGCTVMHQISTHRELGPLCAEIPFTFTGHGNASKHPVPMPVFILGLKAGYNAEMCKAPGRPKMLPDCEDVLEAFAAELQQFRTAGCSINIYNMRYMIVAALQAAGKGHLLSPHLTAVDGEVDRNKFCASHTWLRTFLRKYLKWTWRASTAAARPAAPASFCYTFTGHDRTPKASLRSNPRQKTPVTLHQSYYTRNITRERRSSPACCWSSRACSSCKTTLAMSTWAL